MTSNNPVVSKVIKDYNYTQNAFLPRSVTIPLVEENDINYKSIVNPGDIVKEGDVIAMSTNLDDSPSYIHSSVPGVVEEIVPCNSPDSKQCYGIKIKLKGALSYLGKKIDEEDINYIIASNVYKDLISKGVINTFNISHPVNLGSQLASIKKGSCVVVRLFDEDPYRITDSLVTKFYFNEIIKGAEILAKAIEAPSIVFVLDQKCKNKDLFKDVTLENFKVLEMNIKRYPCGTPREILSAFRRTGLKKTCSFQLKKSDLYIDASSVYDVYKAIFLKTPLMSKIVHLSGNCLQVSCLLDIRIGTTIRELISQIGGLIKSPELVVINGDLCGNSVQSLDVPITKYVKSIKFISKRKITDNQIYNCVGCGNCRSVCPVHISPDILYNTTVGFQSLSGSFARSSLACISCGLCNTVCIARLPLCQTISVLKENVSHILEEDENKKGEVNEEL